MTSSKGLNYKARKGRKYVAGMLKLTSLETNESFVSGDRRAGGFGFPMLNKEQKRLADGIS